MQSFTTRHEESRFLNQVIDSALLQPTIQHRQELLSLAKKHDTQRLAERVRQRATRLSRHDVEHGRHIINNRDELIMAVYADRAPPGWANAWCDGSSSRHGSERHAGVGAVLLEPGGQTISRTARKLGDKSAFDAELSALILVLEIALAHNVERLMVHTDSKALAQLWHEHRADPRLPPVRALASRFKSLHIRAIPRLHNQVANALARQALR